MNSIGFTRDSPSTDEVSWQASQSLSTLNAGKTDVVLKQWMVQICARYLHHMRTQRTPSNGSELDRRLALQILQKAAKDIPEPSVSYHDGIVPSRIKLRHP